MNGREHIPDYNGGIPFELFREDNSNNNNFSYVLPIDANINNKASIKIYYHNENTND